MSGMSWTPTPTPRPRRSRAIAAGVLVVTLPTICGAMLLCGFFSGWPGLVLPLPLILAVLYLYRATTRSTHSPETRAVTREVGAVALALTPGTGTWMSALIAGVWFGVVPLLDSHLVDYPHEAAWMTASTVLALTIAPASWWLLRRFADDLLGDDSSQPPRSDRDVRGGGVRRGRRIVR